MKFRNRLRKKAQAAVTNIISKFRDLKVYFEKVSRFILEV